MKRHQVRRRPVIHGRELVGWESQPDVARSIPAGRVGELVGATGRAGAVATAAQRSVARRNVKKAAAAATRKPTVASMSQTTHQALGRQGGGRRPPLAHRFERAEDPPGALPGGRRRELPGRSKMGGDELAQPLGRR